MLAPARLRRTGLLNLLLLAIAAGAFVVLLFSAMRPAHAYTYTIGDCPVSESEAALDADEQELLRLVNAERAKIGVHPLQPQAALNRFAAWKGRDKGERYRLYDVPDPTGNAQPHDEPLPPDGVNKRPFYERMIDCGHTDVGYAAENAAAGVPLFSPQAVFNAWWNSSAGYHRRNMLNPDYSYTGVARVRVYKPEEQALQYFWIQNFSSEPDPVDVVQPTATPTATATPLATATPFVFVPPPVLYIGPGVSGRFWAGSALPASAFANTFPPQVRAVYQWDNASQTYRFWFRDVGIGTLPGLAPGSFVFFDSLAAASILQGAGSFTLPPGSAFTTANGVTGVYWLGAAYSASDMARALPLGITSVLTWDEETQAFRFWLRNAPAASNTITTLTPGRFYFFEGPGGLAVPAP